MSNFYVKNKDGSYVPVEVKSLIGKELENHLVVVRVGTDDRPASASDLDITEESFACADVIDDMENISLIITPYQIEVGAIHKDDIGDKSLYVQITSGQDAQMLEERVRRVYKALKKKFETVILPIPLKIKDYKKIKDILKRNQIRRERRARVKG